MPFHSESNIRRRCFRLFRRAAPCVALGLFLIIPVKSIGPAGAEIVLQATPLPDCPPNAVVRPDTIYTPGVDARGRPVTPAEGEGAAIYKPPETVTFDIQIDPRDYLGGPGRDAQVAAVAATSAAVTEAESALTSATQAATVVTSSAAGSTNSELIAAAAGASQAVTKATATAALGVRLTYLAESVEASETAAKLVPDDAALVAATVNARAALSRAQAANQSLIAAAQAAARSHHPVGPARLGKVEVDLATGRTRIDGQAIGAPAGPCAAPPSGVIRK